MIRLLDAMLALVAPGELTPTQVHEVRKQLKRARAWLALLRPALDQADAAAVNQALRDAGRRLASARDQAVLQQAYDRMVGKGTQGRHAPATGATHQPVVPGKVSAPNSDKARLLLRRARRRLAQAPIEASGWASLGPGLHRIYRRARRQLPPPDSKPESARLHEWRKQTKRYWHALEPFVPADPARLGKQLAKVRRLADLLGEEHDLAMLVSKMRRRRGALTRAERAVIGRASKRRALLVNRAIALGREVYSQKPRQAERRIERGWRRCVED